jgi:hypothetical protein
MTIEPAEELQHRQQQTHWNK